MHFPGIYNTLGGNFLGPQIGLFGEVSLLSALVSDSTFIGFIAGVVDLYEAGTLGTTKGVLIVQGCLNMSFMRMRIWDLDLMSRIVAFG